MTIGQIWVRGQRSGSGLTLWSWVRLLLIGFFTSLLTSWLCGSFLHLSASYWSDLKKKVLQFGGLFMFNI